MRSLVRYIQPVLVLELEQQCYRWVPYSSSQIGFAEVCTLVAVEGILDICHRNVNINIYFSNFLTICQ